MWPARQARKHGPCSREGSAGGSGRPRLTPRQAVAEGGRETARRQPDERGVRRALGLGDDQMAVDELDRLIFRQDAKLVELAVFLARPSARAKRIRRHASMLVTRRGPDQCPQFQTPHVESYAGLAARTSASVSSTV